MTLKQKLLIGYGVVFALMGLVVAWAVANLVSLGQATDAILSENYRSILAAENMVDALERQDSGILLMFLGDTEKGVAQFRENEAVFLEWMARAKDNVTIEGETALVAAIEAAYGEYRRMFSSLTDLGRGLVEPTLETYQKQVHALFFQVRDVCVQLRNLNEETMYAASLKAGQVANRAIWSTVLVAAAALIVALVFSGFLAERIVRPIRGFMEASRKISSGDYAVEVPVETTDELGRLAGEFNRMSAQLARYHELNIEQIIAEKDKGEAILSSIEDGLVVFDASLRITALNPAARRILDTGFADPTDRSCADMVPAPSLCDLIRRTVETGRPPDLPDEERIVSFSEGEGASHYLFSITVIRGSRDHRLSGVVLLLRDVTRLKEVERLKNEFVMAASHELRTPLTSLGMSVDLLLENTGPNLSEGDRELLQAAHDEVHRMQALVNDLLDLSKIEAGHIELEFERTPVKTLFDHAEALFRPQTEPKGVRLETTLDEALPDIRADANKIAWVLSNLISNALRYVDRGGRIGLAARGMGSYVHLSVADDGPGIPPEYQSRIFDKLVQIKGREPGGSGLGLAICKEIVRAHGGAIWVESRPGEGSTFTFTLPAL